MNKITIPSSQPGHAQDEWQFAENGNSEKGEVQTSQQSPFVPGNRVRVCRGVFMGVEGKVLERCSGTRLVIAVDLQQRGVSLEIDGESLEPAN